MYIRRTTIKSRQTGEPYYTYRLVESVRVNKQVRQKTRLNLGRHFEVPREQWGALVQRIEHILKAQTELFPVELEPQWEEDAQRYAALLINASARQTEGIKQPLTDYQSVDIDSLTLLRPRSVGIEHVALSAVRQLGLDLKLEALGFNGPQCQAALGNLIARRVEPASELATHQWLQQRSGLGELLGADFAKMGLEQLYRVSDKLYANKAALESHVYQQARDCVSLMK